LPISFYLKWIFYRGKDAGQLQNVWEQLKKTGIETLNVEDEVVLVEEEEIFDEKEREEDVVVAEVEEERDSDNAYNNYNESGKLLIYTVYIIKLYYHILMTYQPVLSYTNDLSTCTIIY
jgi:hypothetical protein